MKTVAVLLSLAVLIASASAILNGEVSLHKPYFARVSFTRLTLEENRAGSIISDRFVLTTFYVDAATNYRVWVGSNIRQQQIPYSGSITRVSLDIDGLAVIQLTVPMVFGRNVQPIRMATSTTMMGFVNDQGLVPGMGGTGTQAPANLQSGHMRIVPNPPCQANYPGRNMNSHFCAFDVQGRSDFCPGDIGTGFTLMSRGQEYLYGVALDSQCLATAHDVPSLFINVAFFRQRILEIIEGIQTNRL